MPRLKEVYLINNTLDGTIPTTIGQLANLTHFQISANFIGGSIPTTMCQLSEVIEWLNSSPHVGVVVDHYKIEICLFI